MGQTDRLRSSPRTAAECLQLEKSAILKDWETMARSTIDAAKELKDYVLFDSIPNFIDEIILTLKASYPRLTDSQKVAANHATQRIKLDHFDLNQVLTEYNLVRLAIFQTLDRAGISPTAQERDIILDAIQNGIRSAAVRSMQLSNEREAKVAQALRESETLHRKTFDQAAVGIAHVELNGTWLNVNQRLCDILGYSKNELLGHTFQEITHPDDLQKDLDAVNDLLAGKIRNYQMEKRYIRKDGSAIWANLTVSLVRNNSGEPLYFISVVEDIGRRKQAEKELETTLMNLARANKEHQIEKQLREQFVNSLTHDLRNPLTAAEISAQIIQRHPETIKSVPVVASKIVNNLARIDRMIQDLLDTTRIRAGQRMKLDLETCDLISVANAIIEEMTVVYGDRIRLNSDKSEFFGFWDCHELRRAIENLVTNGFKYGDPNAPVTIIVKSTPPSAVKISVHNWGNPISDEEKPRLFKFFQRGAKTEGIQGWGIGLTLVKVATEAHGGKVSVDSSPERGTTFTLEVPIETPQPSEKPES